LPDQADGRVDVDALQADVERLVSIAVDAATSLEELTEVSVAAVHVGSPVLLEQVAGKLAAEVETALASAGAWEAELTYSKVDAWAQTGHRARMLAEAWSLLAPSLREARGRG
jgi:hypothetical protein